MSDLRKGKIVSKERKDRIGVQFLMQNDVPFVIAYDLPGSAQARPSKEEIAAIAAAFSLVYEAEPDVRSNNWEIAAKNEGIAREYGSR